MQQINTVQIFFNDSISSNLLKNNKKINKKNGWKRELDYVSTIFADKKLANKDPNQLNHIEHQILAQRIFDEGYVIQGIIILHGLIEVHLNRLWKMCVICNGDDPFQPTHNEKSYSNLVLLCNEFGLLNEKEIITDLIDFNKLRNSMSHNYYGEHRKPMSKSETKKRFEQGLLLSGMLPLLLIKNLEREAKFKKNPYAKKILKKMMKMARQHHQST